MIHHRFIFIHVYFFKFHSLCIIRIRRKTEQLGQDNKLMQSDLSNIILSWRDVVLDAIMAVIIFHLCQTNLVQL